MGGRQGMPAFECPETINACYEYPGGFQVVYTGTLVGSLAGGNLIFRGSNAMMKLNRDGFNVYDERVIPFEKTRLPDPVISERADRDGTADHVKNFLDCVRTRRTPNSDVRSAVASARVAHLGNQAFRAAKMITA
jgi:hypothetical protein